MRKSPDITVTELGRNVVEVMAFGCIEYMLEQGLPLTAEGFERLVAISRETGLNGRIAFQMKDWTQQKLQRLLLGASAPAHDVAPGIAERLRTKPSVRKRLLALGLGGDDATLDEEAKAHILRRVQERLGPEVGPILEALRHGECQRELVLERIVQIAADGDPSSALRAFREPGNS